jgi:hypothetical protein
VKQPDGVEGDVALASCTARQGADCLEIGATKFYRVSRDPKAR